MLPKIHVPIAGPTQWLQVQGGPLLVISRVKSPISGTTNPSYPVVRQFIRVITLLITGRGPTF